MSFEAGQPIREPDERVPDALVDALFDRELSPEAQREILRAVRHDRHAGHELERTAEALAALRDQPLAPDLTDRILARADGRRRFLPKRLRRMTRAARLGVSGAMLLVLLGVAGAQRAWPNALSLTSPDTPLADVNNALRGDALQSANSLREGVSVARGSLASFPQRAPRPGFVPTDPVSGATDAHVRVRHASARVAFTPARDDRFPSDPGVHRSITVQTVLRFEGASERAPVTHGRVIMSSPLQSDDDELRGVLP